MSKAQRGWLPVADKHVRVRQPAVEAKAEWRSFVAPRRAAPALESAPNKKKLRPNERFASRQMEEETEPAEPQSTPRKEAASATPGPTPPPVEALPVEPDRPVPLAVDEATSSEDREVASGEHEVAQEMKSLLLKPFSQQKKALKAIRAKWHPDKNPDSVEVATRVFQFIQAHDEWLQHHGLASRKSRSQSRSGRKTPREDLGEEVVCDTLEDEGVFCTLPFFPLHCVEPFTVVSSTPLEVFHAGGQNVKKIAADSLASIRKHLLWQLKERIRKLPEEVAECETAQLFDTRGEVFYKTISKEGRKHMVQHKIPYEDPVLQSTRFIPKQIRDADEHVQRLKKQAAMAATATTTSSGLAFNMTGTASAFSTASESSWHVWS
eukprot:Skav234270  [mRNA]  locus=scaffold1464:1049954:1059237:+ [translate_table: standard]